MSSEIPALVADKISPRAKELLAKVRDDNSELGGA
jgi:hypothetical protein